METFTKHDIELAYKKKYLIYKNMCNKRDKAKLSGDKKKYEHFYDLSLTWAFRLSGMRLLIDSLGYFVKKDDQNNITLEKISTVINRKSV